MMNQEQAMFLRVPQNAGQLLKKIIQGERSETITITNPQQTSTSNNLASSSSSSSSSMYELEIGVGRPKLRGELLHAPNHVDATKPTNDGSGVFTSQGVTKMLVFGDTTSVADPMPGSLLKLAPSGITTPTKDIVKRQFRRGWRYINKYAPAEVAETERVLQDLTQLDKPAYEHVVEEIVDAEPFMHSWFHSPHGQHSIDNCTIVYENGVLTDIFSMDKGTLVRKSTPLYDSMSQINSSSSSSSSSSSMLPPNENRMIETETTTSQSAMSIQPIKSGKGRPKQDKKRSQKPTSSASSSSSSSSAIQIQQLPPDSNIVSVEDVAAIAGAFLDIDEEEMIIDEDIDGIDGRSGVYTTTTSNINQQHGGTSTSEGGFVFDLVETRQGFDNNLNQPDSIDKQDVDAIMSHQDTHEMSKIDTYLKQDDKAQSASNSRSLPDSSSSSSSSSSSLVQMNIDDTSVIAIEVPMDTPEVTKLKASLEIARASLSAEEKKQASTMIAIFKQRWMPQLLAARSEVEKLESELKILQEKR